MSRSFVRFALVRPVPDSYERCVRTRIERIDVSLAKRQHTEYCSVLNTLGLELVWVKRDNSLPDSCFVEDTAVVFGDKAIVSSMIVKSRAKEIAEVARVLKKFKEIFYIRSPAFVDGGDVLKVEDTVFVGLSARTNLQAVKQLSGILKDSGLKVVPVKVRGVLHLKSACTYIGDGRLVLSEEHFDTSILHDLNPIVVPKGEEYAADCLAVNRTVLMAKGYPKTMRLVEKEGFHVRELDVSEFRKGDGALTCLSIIW